MSSKKLMGVLVGGALLAFGLEKLQAQSDIPETVTFAGTIVIQNTNSPDTPGAPTTLKVATKDLLSLIAKAEFNRGNYGATNFPTGAKLVKTGTTGFVQFSVWGKTNNVLIDDVTDQVGLDVVDFAVFTATGTLGSTAYSETDYGDADFYIYDLDARGSTDITMSGYVVNTIKNSAPNQNTGQMLSAQTFTMKAGGGTGSVNGTNDIFNAAISCSFSAKGIGQTF